MILSNMSTMNRSSNLLSATWFGYGFSLVVTGAHYQERDSTILGPSISTVAKVSIFRFPFSEKQTEGVVFDQSQYEILLRHSWHSFLFTKTMAGESEYQMSTSGSKYGKRTVAIVYPPYFSLLRQSSW